MPRPETEHLVEAALALELPARPCLLDLGTGSGCLAVTLALEVPAAEIWAVDRSLGALASRHVNARRHGVAHRVRLAGSDWAAALAVARFDASSPIRPISHAEQTPALSPEVVGFEPPGALFAGDAGSAEYGRLLATLSGARPGTALGGRDRPWPGAGGDHTRPGRRLVAGAAPSGTTPASSARSSSGATERPAAGAPLPPPPHPRRYAPWTASASLAPAVSRGASARAAPRTPPCPTSPRLCSRARR